MSRIGKLPVSIPASVTVDIKDGEVFVKGPKGQLTRKLNPAISLKKEDNKIHVVRSSDDRIVLSLHGLSRTLLANMVKGVTEGFETSLEVIGVGYRAQTEGKKLVMQLGYSHPVEITPPAGLNISVGKGNLITISGIDKQAVGDMAAYIRNRRPPEVYKGKGVKYQGEVIRRKAGKAASKKK